MRVGSADDDRQRDSTRVDQQAALAPVFSLSIGLASLPEFHKETFILPTLKMRVNGAGSAELARQRLPLTAGAQHIDDGSENLSWGIGFRPAPGLR